MLYGHRRDVAGYAASATEFDRFLADFLPGMREGDLLMITADHGNAEQMVNPETGNPQTAHTTFEVPLIYVGQRPARLLDGGSLCDIAPTLLAMMDQPVPEEMTGRVLIDFGTAS